MTRENDNNDLAQALKVLKSGGIILYPTDTVWGIGCDATNADAVRRIYALKQRDDKKALITLVSGLGMLERTVSGIAEVAYQLIEYADRPLTIVYDKGIGVCREMLPADGTLAVRVVSGNFAARLCGALRHPLVSTSANISGQRTPATYDEISREILDGVDYVCTTGRNDTVPHRSSTIIRLTESGEYTLLRK